MIKGLPGVGKTELTYEIVRKNPKKFIVFSLSASVYNLKQSGKNILKDFDEIQEHVSRSSIKSVLIIINDIAHLEQDIYNPIINFCLNNENFKLIANYKDIFNPDLVMDLINQFETEKNYVEIINLKDFQKEEEIKDFIHLYSLPRNIEITNLIQDGNPRNLSKKIFLINDFSSIDDQNSEQILDNYISRSYFSDLRVLARFDEKLNYRDYIFLFYIINSCNIIPLNSEYFQNFVDFWNSFNNKISKVDESDLINSLLQLYNIGILEHFRSQSLEYYVRDEKLDDILASRIFEVFFNPRTENRLGGNNYILSFDDYSKVFKYLNVSKLSISYNIKTLFSIDKKETIGTIETIFSYYYDWIKTQNSPISLMNEFGYLSYNYVFFYQSFSYLDLTNFKNLILNKILSISNEEMLYLLTSILFSTELNNYDETIVSLKELFNSFDDILLQIKFLDHILKINNNYAESLVKGNNLESFLLLKSNLIPKLKALQKTNDINYIILLCEFINLIAKIDINLIPEQLIEIYDIENYVLHQTIRFLINSNQQYNFDLIRNFTFFLNNTYNLINYYKKANMMNFEDPGNFINLTCKIDRDITQLSFYIQGELRGTIDYPLNLFQCSFGTDHILEWNHNSECHLHQLENSREILDNFGTEVNEIIYDNISIFWISSISKWPPSIDSFIFCKTLFNKGYLSSSISNIADIGCGTGVLGIYLSIFNENIRKVVFSDIEPQSVDLAINNFTRMKRLNNRNDLTHDYRKGAGLRVLNINEKFDLILCLPPYIPMFNRTLQFTSPAEGTGLLQEVVKNFRFYSNELIIGLSNLANPDFLNCIKFLKESEKVNVDFILLNEIDNWVPFRIPWIKQDHLDELVKERGLLPHPPEGFESRGMKYWQKILIYSVKILPN